MLTTHTTLMKIREITMGMGGYQGAEFGLFIQFEGSGCGVGTSLSMWARDPDEHCRWTQKDQERTWADAMRLVRDTLIKSRRRDLASLVGIPVEVTFGSDDCIKSWRVLEEVL